MDTFREAGQLEFHRTPKYGSWLNQAEIRISIFERSCLSWPPQNTTTLQQRARALESERNARRATIEWQTTNRQARLNRKAHSPVVEPHHAVRAEGVSFAGACSQALVRCRDAGRTPSCVYV